MGFSENVALALMHLPDAQGFFAQRVNVFRFVMYTLAAAILLAFGVRAIYIEWEKGEQEQSALSLFVKLFIAKIFILICGGLVAEGIIVPTLTSAEAFKPTAEFFVLQDLAMKMMEAVFGALCVLVIPLTLRPLRKNMQGRPPLIQWPRKSTAD